MTIEESRKKEFTQDLLQLLIERTKAYCEKHTEPHQYVAEGASILTKAGCIIIASVVQSLPLSEESRAALLNEIADDIKQTIIALDKYQDMLAEAQ